ncbi:MAG: HD domain-containing phosphohydrolase [Gaiellaceae bacterium]
MAATTSTRTLAPSRGRVAADTDGVARVGGKGLLLGLCGLFGLYVAWLLIEPGSAKWLYNVLLVGSAFVCLSTPLRRSKERAAWLCLGITLLLWAAGDFYYTLFLWNQNAAPPTVTDWFWLASYPFLYASIALLVRSRTAHFDRTLWLDAILAALAVAAVGAAVLFGAVVDSTGGPPLLAAMNLAYPLADALLLGIVVAVLALTGWRLDRTWLCVVAGTAVLALTDSAFLYQASAGAAQTPILDAGWPLAMLLFTAAAWQPVRELGAVKLEGARMLAVPAVFGLTALAILVYGQFGSLNTPAVVLAATSMLAVIARMAFSFREKLVLLSASRVEARTDPLTGIGNRRKLIDDLTAKLNAQTPTVLILLDLDGFKGYNDSFGHPAGDALLARLAKKLAAAIAGEGEVYRIGGDEFCVLGAVEPPQREAFAAAAAEALQEHGEGFLITAAQGSVALPEEAVDVAEALRLVDGRMYDEKDGRRASAGRQSRDVLLRALYERDERLQGRLVDIVELVRPVGERLGLSADEVGDLALAAELHEVGKLAIPDSILTKREPLSEDEERFLHRHPLIGERILSSAPALAKVSRIVRSIHERFDGTGYPDGLAGQEIPFRSRIIGTCAAYIGLTTTSTPDEAVSTLRLRAGTEFDPEVLDALASIVLAVAEPPVALATSA